MCDIISLYLRLNKNTYEELLLKYAMVARKSFSEQLPKKDRKEAVAPNWLSMRDLSLSRWRHIARRNS